jgi:hypothetical protein
MGAIRTKEKNHGIQERDQEAEEGQESTTDEDPKVLAERFFIHVLVTAHWGNPTEGERIWHRRNQTSG